MLKPESYVGNLVLRRYRLDDVISSGGMGVLYGATHLRTGRRVAIKFLLDSDDNERFALEARAAVELKHPNVVDVIDMDEDEDGVPFLVLELLEGRSLAAVLQETPRLQAEQALAWMLPIMGALAVAHDRGILHRDLKPANIFIANASGGRTVPKLLDFGVAKVQSQPTLTRSGSVVGTPSYMSPEQARGDRDLLSATDVWGMGVIWFRLLTGRLPFEHEAVIGTLMRIVNERAPRVETVAKDVPRALGWAIDRALQHDPAVRYPDMRTFARALIAGALRDGLQLPAAPDPSGFPDWANWLREEQLTASTGAVPIAAPSWPPLSSPPPPLPALMTASTLQAVEFAPTQPKTGPTLPTLPTTREETTQGGRPRRKSLVMAALVVLALLGGFFFTYGASPEQDAETPAADTESNQRRAEPPLEMRLPPEKPPVAEVSQPPGGSTPPATQVPVPEAKTPAVETKTPAAEPKKASAADPALAKRRSERKKGRDEPRGAPVVKGNDKPVPVPAAQDGLSIETNWR